MKTVLLLLDAADNVAVALEPLESGTRCVCQEQHLTVTEHIPFAHKIARKPIMQGQHVLKYGESIGIALTNIPAGAWVHTHNLSVTL